MREHLLGYLLGALDETEQAQVEELLQRDPQLRNELKQLGASLEPMRAGADLYPEPEGLAERTCKFVAEHATVETSSLPSSSSQAAGRYWRNRRWTFADVFVAGGVVATASLLFFPAILNSRQQARVSNCGNNLRALHLALVNYSSANHHFLPTMPTEGNLAFAGVYAPLVYHGGYIDRPNAFLCPASPRLPFGRRFRIPTVGELNALRGLKLALLQSSVGGSYGYNLGYFVDNRHHGIRYRGRSNFAVMSDSPSLHFPRRQSDNHDGKGQNILFEDGHVRYTFTCRAGCDDVFLSDRRYVEAGRQIHDAVIARSTSPPLLPHWTDATIVPASN